MKPIKPLLSLAIGVFLCVPSWAQLPQTMDEGVLSTRIKQSQGTSAQAREDRVWLYLARASLQALRGGVAAAEVDFSQASVEASASGNKNLQEIVVGFRVDSLSAAAMASGNWVGLKQLTKAYKPYPWKQRPPVVQTAAEYTLCLQAKDYNCVAKSHKALLEILKSNAPTWQEDWNALGVLAYQLDIRDISNWAVFFLLQYLDAQKLTPEAYVSILLQAVEMYSRQDPGMHLDHVKELLKAADVHIVKWPESDLQSTASFSIDDPRRKLSLKRAVLGSRMALSASDELIAKEVLQLSRLSDLEHADMNGAEVNLLRLSARIGGFQSALVNGFSNTLDMETRASLIEKLLLVLSYSILPPAPRDIYATTLIRLLKVDDPPSLRRRVFRSLCLVARCDLGLEVGLPLLEGPIGLAESGGPVSSMLATDMIDLALMAPRARDGASVAKLSNALSRAVKIQGFESQIGTLGAWLRVATDPTSRIDDLEAVAAKVWAETTYVPTARIDLLWHLIRGREAVPGDLPRLSKLLSKFEALALAEKDEDLVKAFRLKRAVLLSAGTGAAQSQDLGLGELQQYLGDSSMEILRVAVIAHRAKVAAWKGQFSQEPLCDVKGLYRDAGSPDLGFVKLTEDERRLLVESGGQPGASCGSSEAMAPAVAEHLRLLGKRPTRLQNERIDEQLVTMVLGVVSLPDGKARVEAEKTLFGALDLPSRARRMSIGSKILSVFDTLGLPFAPEALRVSVLARGEKANSEEAKAANERLAIARTAAFRTSVDLNEIAASPSLISLLVDPGLSLETDVNDHLSLSPKGSPRERRAAESKSAPALAISDLAIKLPLLIENAKASGCRDVEIERLGKAVSALATIAEQQLRTEQIYRVAQAALYCNQLAEVDSILLRAAQAAKAKGRPFDELLMWAYWAADNQDLGRLVQAQAAAKRAQELSATLVAETVTQKSYRSHAAHALLVAGFHTEAAALAEVAVEDNCEAKAEATTRCQGLMELWLLARTINLSQGEISNNLRALLKKGGNSAKVPVSQVALDAFEGVAGATGKSVRLGMLELASSSLAGAPATSLQSKAALVRMAKANLCVGDRVGALKIVQQLLKDTNPSFRYLGLTWKSANAPAASPQDRDLHRAYGVAEIELEVKKSPEGKLAWVKLGLPSLVEAANSLDKVPVSQRAYALLLRGYVADAIALLRKDLARLRRELPMLDSTDFQEQLVRSIVAEKNDEALMSAGTVLMAVEPTLNRDALVRGAARRLLGQAAYRRGDLSVALGYILGARAIERGSQTGLAADASDMEGQIYSNTEEDLLAAARDRSVRNSGEVFLLQQSQRSMLAYLLAKRGGSVFKDTERANDLAFKLLQASVVGPTSVDLLNSLRLEDESDPDIRRAVAALAGMDSEGFGAAAQVDFKRLLAADNPSTSLSCPSAEGSMLSQSHPLRTRGERINLRRIGSVGTFARIPNLLPGMANMASFDMSKVSANERVTKVLQRFSENKSGGPVSLKSLVTRLAPSQGVLFVVSTDQVTHAALVTKNGLRIAELQYKGRAIGEATMESLVRGVRKRLVTGQKEELPSKGDPLYHMVFDQFESELASVTDLAVVARGPLETLPFSILYLGDSSSGPGKWFDDRFVWHFALAASDSSTAKGPRVGPRQIVQFGPPSFTGGADCQRTLSAEDSGKGLAERLCPIQTLSYLLPSNTGEASIRTLSEGAATKGAFLKLGELSGPGRIDTLILASHGLQASETNVITGVNEPSIALASPSSLARSAFVLRSSEISDMALNVDEVVLVACNSAGAAADSGEKAFSGLVRSFFRAGARQLVAAVASVPSETTKLMMRRYFASRGGDLSSAKALSEARGAIRRAGFEPEFWGGMVAIGTY